MVEAFLIGRGQQRSDRHKKENGLNYCLKRALSSAMKYLQAYEGRTTQLLQSLLTKGEGPSSLLMIQAVTFYLVTPIILLNRDWKWKRFAVLIVLTGAWLEITSNINLLNNKDGDLGGKDRFSPMAIQGISHEMDAIAAAQSGQSICYCLSSLLAKGEGISTLPIVIRSVPSMLRTTVLIMSILGVTTEPHLLNWVFPSSCRDNCSSKNDDSDSNSSSSNMSDKLQLLIDMLVLPFEVRQIPNALKFLSSSSTNDSPQRSFMESFRKIAAISLLANYIRVRLSSNLTAAKAVQITENSKSLSNTDLDGTCTDDQEKDFGSHISESVHETKGDRDYDTSNDIRNRGDENRHQRNDGNRNGRSFALDKSSRGKKVSNGETKVTSEARIQSIEKDLSVIKINVGNDRRKKSRRSGQSKNR